jgi:hypothetical protein
VPEYLFWSRLEMIERIQARDALEEIDRLRAATSARLSPEGLRRYEADLNRAAHVRPQRATQAQMQAMGIETVMEPGVHPGWAALEQKAEQERGEVAG